MPRRPPSAAQPPHPPKLLDEIVARRQSLRRSEQRVADTVLRAAEAVTRMSMAELAEAAEVSEPTVLRFCRQIGCDGFPELKLRLAQSLVSGVPYVHREIALGDDVEQVIDKVCGASVHAIDGVRGGLDREALRRAIAAIAGARRIECFGNGAASILAFDAQQKFMRFGIPTIAYPDGHSQVAAAATLGTGDVALCFSHTGAVKDIVRAAEIASAGGATVVTMTRSSSPLARAGHIHVAVDTAENTEIYAPMISRVAHMVVLDVLATGVALAFGPEVVERLRKVKESAAYLRTEPAQARRRPS